MVSFIISIFKSSLIVVSCFSDSFNSDRFFQSRSMLVVSDLRINDNSRNIKLFLKILMECSCSFRRRKHKSWWCRWSTRVPWDWRWWKAHHVVLQAWSWGWESLTFCSLKLSYTILLSSFITIKVNVETTWMGIDTSSNNFYSFKRWSKHVCGYWDSDLVMRNIILLIKRGFCRCEEF